MLLGRILIISSFILISSAICAKDITTTDGKTYKDIEVIKIIPDGIIIEYTDPKTGFDVLKNLKYEKLPKSLLQEYKIDTSKGLDFEKKFDNSQAESKNNSDIVNEKDYVAEENKELEKYSDATDRLEGQGIEINFKADQVLDGGTLGWGTKEEGENDIDLGKIFIKNALYNQSYEFSGRLYPTKEIKTLQDGTKVPVYEEYKNALDKELERDLEGLINGQKK